jgi:hypothetical protein
MIQIINLAINLTQKVLITLKIKRKLANKMFKILKEQMIYHLTQLFHKLCDSQS